MTLEDARAYVGQFVSTGTSEQLEKIAQHMALTGTCVLHACWEIFGRDRGRCCYCTPCMQARGELQPFFGLPRGVPAA